MKPYILKVTLESVQMGATPSEVKHCLMIPLGMMEESELPQAWRDIHDMLEGEDEAAS